MAEKLQNPTKELFPSMMERSRLLILDYDVTRYHSFDLFRLLLLKKENFQRCDPKLLKMAEHQELSEQILYYMRNCTQINPFENFKENTIHTLSDYETELNQYFSEPQMKITPTDLEKRLGIIFGRNNVSGYWLKYAKDPHKLPFQDMIKIYTSDRILDMRMAIAIVMKHQINAIMVSSAELAILLAHALLKEGYTHAISFMIGTYFYNYDPERKIMRHMPEMDAFEYAYKHEFGIFDPYSGLNEMRKEGLLHV